VRLRRALAATPCVSFYRYQVSFKLTQLEVTIDGDTAADAVTVYNQSEDEATMRKTATRDREREDDLLTASKAITPERRLEAAARLSAIAFQFHQAGLAYRENLRAGNGSVDNGQGEGKREA